MSNLKRILFIVFLFLSQLIVAQDTQYYLLFSARFPTLRPFSLGGHSFVTWRSEDTIAQIYDQVTYGFYPTHGMGILKNVAGTVHEGYVRNSNRELLVRRFIIQVDSAQFAETMQQIEIWKTQPYSLLSHNCNHFMNAVIEKLGLKSVKIRKCLFPMYPYKYIRKLKKLNALRIVKNNYLEKVRIRILKKAKVEEEKDDEEIN